VLTVPRTPLAEQISSMFARAGAQHAEERGQPSLVGRRAVLTAAAAGAAALAGAPLVGSRSASAASSPRIVIVGAGLAGLTAAYQLRQAGYLSSVYEANTRLGGRCWSYNHGEFAAGQIAEHGGELIDQGHTALRQLAQSLGLTLDNLLAGEPNGTEDFYRFLGKPYSFDQATNDLKAIWQTIHSDLSAASYPTLYNSSTQRGRELDQISISTYIEQVVPGGHKAPLGQLLDVAYNIEYGAETTVQSSLNMLYLLAFSGQGQMRIFGHSNEKYHVRGGNDQVVTRLAAALAGQITTGAPLQSIARNADGTYSLSFSGVKAVTADHVILALPFSLLRKVDYKKAGFNAIKVKAITELPMGTNSKLHVQFTDRYWYSLGNNGNTYADTGYQSTWEVTRAQPGTQGILVDYTGGNVGASFAPTKGTPQARAQTFLQQIEPLLPGITPHWNGRATIDYWAGNPWSLGSYSYWKVGQYTGFSGAEKEASGNCHFAGEHTSQDFQGFLNGAVETGQRAADEILAVLK
jgi:monoamine oxidase